MNTTAFQFETQLASNNSVFTSNNAFTEYRTIVRETESRWYLMLREQLSQLTLLKKGWDGYSGIPVSFQCAHFTALILNRICQNNVACPQLVPGTDGSLQIEWHRGRFEIELDVLGPNNVIASRYNIDTGVEEEIDIQNDFSEIVEWITELSTS